MTRDLEPAPIFRRLAHALREAGLDPAERLRALRHAGCLLALDHAELEELARERPEGGHEVEGLYEVLLEVAARREAFDELDALLVAGGYRALGVTPEEHGERVGVLLAAPRVPPARQRGGEEFGRVHRLFGEDDDGPLLLGDDHGPSTPCPACSSSIRITDTGERSETKRGVHSTHAVRCRTCWLRGTLRRFYSFRLRGNRDELRVLFPGVLGPLATRAWARRAGAGLLAGGLVAAALGRDALPPLLVGLLLLGRSEAPSKGWGLALGGLGTLVIGLLASRAPVLTRGWLVAFVAALGVAAHAVFATYASPEGWSHADSP